MCFSVHVCLRACLCVCVCGGDLCLCVCVCVVFMSMYMFACNGRPELIYFIFARAHKNRTASSSAYSNIYRTDLLRQRTRPLRRQGERKIRHFCQPTPFTRILAATHKSTRRQEAHGAQVITSY